jgi:flagellar biogenesis protein FliO
MRLTGVESIDKGQPPLGGVTGWLLGRLRKSRRAQARLEVIERITLGPRQSLVLVEADGRRLLVATSPEGATAFYALDGAANGISDEARMPQRAAVATRAAW